MTVSNTTPPTVTGLARQGSTLTTSNGAWTYDLDYLTYAYQWMRCDAAGANCVDIAGATSRTYFLTAQEVGYRIRSEVTATEHASAGGYTDYASVDLSREPLPPSPNTNQNVTSPLTISTTVTDKTFNVTAGMTNAITLTSTGRLERCVVDCNGLAANAVSGPGTCADVLVREATNHGFNGVKNFEGCCKSTRCGNRGFYLTGSGVSSPTDCLMKSDDDNEFGLFFIDLNGANLLGALAGLNTGNTVGQEAATGLEFWANVSDGNFGILIGNGCPGYGFALYGAGSANNYIKEVYCDADNQGGDPALSIGGGANNNTIDKMTSLGYTVGCIMGEDVSPSPHHNRVKTLIVSNAPYPGIVFDRGAHDNVIGEDGGATLTNTGSADVYLASVNIANRSGQPAPPPYNNQVLGLVQSGGGIVPEYAVYCGTGTSNNTVTGSASSFSIAKVKNDGSGNTISV